MTKTALPPTGTNTVDDSILMQFVSTENPHFKTPIAIWNYRGDLTQSGSDQMKQALGDKAFEHYNWDTAVTTGRIFIILRRFKHAQAIKPPLGIHFPAPWYWCFSQIEDNEEIELAKDSLINRVPVNLRESLKVLPGLEWIKVRRVSVTIHGRGKPKQKFQKPPEGVLFFRFQGGLGLAIAE